MQLIDIIIIAALAIFIITRFTSVQLPKDKELKKRNRNKSSNIMNFPAGDTNMANEAFSPKPKARKVVKKPENFEMLSGLEQLKTMDTSFNENEFLDGAKGAYNYLYDLIADADEEAMDDLTSPRLLDRLMEDIETMDEAGLKRIVDVKSVDNIVLLDARLNGMTAIVDVKYTVSQADYVTDAEGNIQEGFSDEASKVETIWTWARSINSDDPNWELEEISNLV